MPVQLAHPGVYIEEVPSGVRTITGVATSITAFIGRTSKGRLDDPVRIQSFADYEREFGGLAANSPMGYSVQHYFLHGGKDALIVRVATNSATAATISLPTGAAAPDDILTLIASSVGAWGESLQVEVDHDTADTADTNLFNLTINLLDSPGSTELPIASEEFLNVSIDPNSSRSVENVLEFESQYVRVSGAVPGARPSAATTDANLDGDDGGDITDAEVSAASLETDREGLWALNKADLFNIVCIPPLSFTTDVGDQTLSAAAGYCKAQRAMLITDPPQFAPTAAASLAPWTDTASAVTGVNALRGIIGNDAATNCAVFFPNLRMADPLRNNQTRNFAPSGAVAGIIARTDAQRGVWKAPAGLEASFLNVREFSFKLDDGGNGQINPLAVNALRSFPVYGRVIWGARTLAGANRLASEWKYIPVRRTALFIEESLYRGTQWVVFEPNDEPLWAQIRLNIGAFMQNLFRQGAFQGSSPREAYFVKCDKETTTQNDINRGVVNVQVGFAPLKPAEFVVISIQQKTGEVQV